MDSTSGAKYFLFGAGILLLCLVGCKVNKIIVPNQGIWRAALQITDKEELPFLFELKTDSTTKKITLYIINAEERIEVDEITQENDSLFIKLPVFDSEIKCLVQENKMFGEYINHAKYKDNVVPFSAEYENENRFEGASNDKINISGKWEVHFSPDAPNHYPAIGMFQQENGLVKSTFLTPTGDYRFIDGKVVGNRLSMSCFDGAHAFLFKAEIEEDGSMNGTFWSGNSWNEPWVAKKNENFVLPGADTLTYLKEGYDSVNFSFPDKDSNMVALSDEKYKNKPVIVQIMGSWCPNCMEESEFLSEYYNNEAPEDLQIIALAYERGATFERAWQNVERLKKKYNIQYDILMAQFGSSDKKLAATTLPMLNHILSYPTTIFIDRNKQVKRIYTGFSGKATGEYFEKFKKDFYNSVEIIL